MSIYLGSNKIDTFGTSINTTTFYDNSIEDAFINRTISTYENNNISFIGAYAFCSCSSLTTANFPACTSIGSNAFYGCYSLTTASFPACTSIGSSAFTWCCNLLSVYLISVSSVPTLGNYAFSSTPIGDYTASTGGVYGSIFVPSSLYTAFTLATNWNAISARIVAWQE